MKPIANYSSLHRNLIFGFEVKMMPTENIQEFRSVGAWNVSFCAQFACGLTMWPKWPDQGAAGRTRDLQT